MKKLIAVCLASLFIFCCTDQIATLPEYWEYSPGKWVAFINTIELEWKYRGSKIDKFKIAISKAELNDDDIKEIIKLIRKKDVDGLVAKEASVKKKLKFDEKMDNYIPAFGEICFYNASAIEKISGFLPAGLSVIFLDRSK